MSDIEISDIIDRMNELNIDPFATTRLRRVLDDIENDDISLDQMQQALNDIADDIIPVDVSSDHMKEFIVAIGRFFAERRRMRCMNVIYSTPSYIGTC